MTSQLRQFDRHSVSLVMWSGWTSTSLQPRFALLIVFVCLYQLYMCNCYLTLFVVVWPTTSCCTDWSKRDHVTLVIIGRCTLERLTVQHFSIALQCVTFYHGVTHVARLFLKLAENENRTNTSNLQWVDLYWDNARMRMYGHHVQSINELFIAERNTN